MMTRLISAAAASALLLGAMPALAQEVESDAIEAKNIEKGKQSISAERAYILLTGPDRSQGLLYKTPNEDDLSVFKDEWEEEYAKARKKYESKLADYEEEQEALKNGRRAPNTRLMDKPDEVNRETFSIGSVERRLTVGWGPMYVFDKGEDASGEKVYSYLIELDPGEYTYYGPIFLAPNGSAMGTCMCMGSVKFEAKPGVVTNLGDFAAMRWIDDEAGRQTSVNWDEFAEDREPARPIDYTVPAPLRGYDVVKADLRAAGKVDNWYGIMVSRLAPMDGVLAYERDRIVDVKALATAEPKQKTASAPPAADSGVDDSVMDAATDAEEVALTEVAAASDN